MTREEWLSASSAAAAELRSRAAHVVGGYALEAGTQAWTAVVGRSDVTLAMRPVAVAPAHLRLMAEFVRDAASLAAADKECKKLEFIIDKDLMVMQFRAGGAGLSVKGAPVAEAVKRYGAVDIESGGGLCNAFAHSFSVTTIDASDPGNSKLLKQEWSAGMETVSPPSYRQLKKKPGMVEVTFCPLAAVSEHAAATDVVAAYTGLVVMASVTLPGRVKVSVDGAPVPVKNVDQLANLLAPGRCIACCKQDDRWRVAVAWSDGEFRHTSMCNGTPTPVGGAHVDGVKRALAAAVCAEARRKHMPLNQEVVLKHMWLFVSALVGEPKYEGPAQQLLGAAAVSEWWVPPDSMVRAVMASPIVSAARDAVEERGPQVKGLEDAVRAGGADAEECVLFVADDVVSRAFVTAGLESAGREYYGLFTTPARLPNVRLLNDRRFNEDDSVDAFRRALGVRGQGALRYGRVVVVSTDERATALVLALLHRLCPEKLRRGLMHEATYPTWVARRGHRTVAVYTADQLPPDDTWSVTPFGGVAGASSEVAAAVFRTMRMAPVTCTEADDDAFSKTFDACRAEERRAWFERWVRRRRGADDEPPDSGAGKMLEAYLVAKYSEAARKVPALMDGLTGHQRRVVACLTGKAPTTVARVALDVCDTPSEVGEAVATVTGLAQDFVGANALPWLSAEGQAGTRAQGGRDAAAPNRVSVRLADHVSRLFFDDRTAPIIPTVLVNGVAPIESPEGWGVFVPPHDPRAVIAAVRAWIRAEPVPELKPHWRRFSGFVEERGNQLVTVGRFHTTQVATTLAVTELPIGTTNDAYVNALRSLVADGFLKSFDRDTEGSFLLHFPNEAARTAALADRIRLEARLALITNFDLGRMRLVGRGGEMHLFPDTGALLKHWCSVRLPELREDTARSLAALREQAHRARATAIFLEKKLAKPHRFDGQTAAAVFAACVEADVPVVQGGYDFVLAVTQKEMTKEGLEAARALAGELEALVERASKTPEQLWLDALDALEACV